VTDRVVNLRDFRVKGSVFPGDIKIGRWWYRLPDDVVRIDRSGRWGNPFPIGMREGDLFGTTDLTPLTRERSVEEYRAHLFVVLQQIDPDFLKPLRGKRLACWCDPLLCHGHVIAEMIP